MYGTQFIYGVINNLKFITNSIVRVSFISQKYTTSIIARNVSPQQPQANIFQYFKVTRNRTQLGGSKHLSTFFIIRICMRAPSIYRTREPHHSRSYHRRIIIRSLNTTCLLLSFHIFSSIVIAKLALSSSLATAFVAPPRNIV